MRKALITGFALLIPLLTTLYVFIFIIDIAAIPFLALSKVVLNAELLSRYAALDDHLLIQKLFAKTLAIVFLLLAAYVLGLLARHTFRKHLIDTPLDFCKRIPYIGPLIALTADVSHKLLDPNQKNFFKQTVLVPFFSPSRYVIGLVTSQSAPSFIKDHKDINQVVFIPTAPHPISGFLILTDSEALKLTQLNPSDALAFVISCGTNLH